MERLRSQVEILELEQGFLRQQLDLNSHPSQNGSSAFPSFGTKVSPAKTVSALQARQSVTAMRAKEAEAAHGVDEGLVGLREKFSALEARHRKDLEAAQAREQKLV